MQFGKTFDSPAPVVSFSFFDQSTFENGYVCGKTRMLVVVRNPDTNRTHPNVISVPTQRVPRTLFQSILKTAREKAKRGNTTYYQGRKINGLLENGHHPIIYAVESLISRKLELSRELESNTLDFVAELRAVTTGKAYYTNLNEEETEECISMANIMVTIKHGTHLFPLKSRSYSYISWVEVDNFLKTVQEKDPVMLQTGLDPIDYCIHGLCISTTYSILEEMFGVELYTS